MKSWRKPEAVGQEFAANEYVSACEVTTVDVVCSVDSNELYANFWLAVPADAPAQFVGGEYRGCDAELTVPIAELGTCTFTHIADGWGNVPDTALKNPIEAYYWIGTKANGDPDFHAFPATADLNATIESGKS